MTLSATHDFHPFSMNPDGVTVTTGQRQRNVMIDEGSSDFLSRHPCSRYPTASSSSERRSLSQTRNCDGHSIRPCSKYQSRPGPESTSQLVPEGPTGAPFTITNQASPDASGHGGRTGGRRPAQAIIASGACNELVRR